MDNISLRIDAGSVRSIIGEMKFAFIAKPASESHIQIYCSDPTDGRKAGVLLTLNHEKYMELKAIIKKIDDTIEMLYASNQISKNSF